MWTGVNNMRENLRESEELGNVTAATWLVKCCTNKARPFVQISVLVIVMSLSWSQVHHV